MSSMKYDMDRIKTEVAQLELKLNEVKKDLCSNFICICNIILKYILDNI